MKHVKCPIAPAVAGKEMANMEVIMQTKCAILAASAVVLSGSGLIMPDTASARHHTGHRSLVSGHTNGYAPGRAPRYQYVPARPRRAIYDSLSNGDQPYPNPDRDFFGPNAAFSGGN
jgi:hypothetical protein